jgi:hypothetical protein
MEFLSKYPADTDAHIGLIFDVPAAEFPLENLA